jgi:ABC-type glycerol-3-phosphate transport system substrate-binding protein
VGCFVNPRSLERAGISQLGETYPERLDDARRLTDAETHVYGWGVVADLPELETVAGSAGVGVWSKDGRESGLDAENFVSAWQWYADLIHVERVSPPCSAWDGLLGGHWALTEGRVAMTLRSHWVHEALVQEAGPEGVTWRTGGVPQWEQAAAAVPVNADYSAVTAQTAQPAAAAELAWFLASEGVQPSSHPGIPAWLPALEQAAEWWQTDASALLASRTAWARPALDLPRAAEVEDALRPVLRAVIARGEPAALHAPGLAARLSEIAQRAAEERQG